MSAELANKLERLCCAETEREFFNCVADNLPAIVTALRAAAVTEGLPSPDNEAWADTASPATGEK